MFRQSSRLSLSWTRKNSRRGSLLYSAGGKYPMAYCCEKFSTKISTNQKPDWNQAVSEAEKVIGYPTSFLSLRWLLSDEIANVALHLQKLIGSSHPLLNTAKNLIYNEQDNIQTWGLVVLLVSKAAGPAKLDDFQGKEDTTVLFKQRALAEVTEMIRTANLVHKGLVNIRRNKYSQLSEYNDMVFGNKIALLSGDYLLGISTAKLSFIANHDVLLLMSFALRDLSESEFTGRRDNQNIALPAVPSEKRAGYALKEWSMQNFLASASLLEKSCEGTLIIAGHAKELQKQAREFGKHLAFAWQAYHDLEPFLNKDRYESFNLCSAPVMFHIEYDPSILVEIDKGVESVTNVDYGKIYDIVASGPGIELTKQLQQDHSQRAMDILNNFHESDARTALSKIIASIGH